MATTDEMKQKIAELFKEPPKGERTAGNIASHFHFDGLTTYRVLQDLVRDKVLSENQGNANKYYLKGENFNLFFIKE